MATPTVLPEFVSSNGIHRFCLHHENPNRGSPQDDEYIFVEPNSDTFTALASAVNLGLQILESPRGKDTLTELGIVVVAGWRQAAGSMMDVSQMADFVRHFLSRTRNDFPNVFVTALGGPDVLGATARMELPELGGPGLWPGDPFDFKPKFAVGLYFNAPRVAAMAAATAEMWRSHTSGSERRRLLQRHKQFQFVFGLATAHELCHTFVCYLSKHYAPEKYTPPSVTHLDYHGGVEGDGNNSIIPVATGESGRWFENALLGGSLEFYRDMNDDDGQAGIPHILDENSNERNHGDQSLAAAPTVA